MVGKPNTKNWIETENCRRILKHVRSAASKLYSEASETSSSSYDLSNNMRAGSG
jgi:hypothetical protein